MIIKGFERSMQSKAIARVLIVDDEVGTGYALKLLLEVDGYHVLLAADGDEAWRLACADPPDFLITDIFMPRMNGLELIQKLKRQPRLFDLPIIVISSAEQSELEYACELGARAALQKPIQYESLLACLQTAARPLPASDLKEIATNSPGHFPSRF